MLHHRSKQQLQNDDTIEVQWSILNIVLQEAMMTTIFPSVILQGATTMVDHNKHAISPKQQPTLWLV